MKTCKLLMLLALFVAMASCNDDDKTVENSIVLDPDEVNINFHPQVVSTTVSGAAAWTLKGNYSWVTPSVTSGGNGTQINFQTGINTTGKVRAAKFEILSESGNTFYIVKQTSGQIVLLITVDAIESSNNSIDVDMNIDSEDVALFSQWGVCYSEGETVTDAVDFLCEGTPTSGTVRIKIPDLEKDKIYNIWGFVVDAQGNRIYSEESTSMLTGAASIEAKATTEAFARTANITFDFDINNISSVGVCWSKEQEPTVDDEQVSIETPVAGKQTFTASLLEGSTTYYARLFGVRTDDVTIYGEQFTFTTMADPLNSLLSGENNCLTHYVNGSGVAPLAPSAYQKELEDYVNAAFLSVYQKPCLYTRNLITSIDEQPYMLINFFGEKDPGDYQQANQYGGLAYKISRGKDNTCSFELDGFQYIYKDAWLVSQGKENVDSFAQKLYWGISDRINFDKYVNFWGYTFYMDWADTSKSAVKIVSKDDTSKFFNYRMCKETFENNYDLTVYPMSKGGDDDAFAVSGAGNNLLIQPGDVANFKWKVNFTAGYKWSAKLVKGACLGTDPGTDPTLNYNLMTGDVSISYTAPAQSRKFHRQWTLVITSGSKSYYALIYEQSNNPESTENPNANQYAIHADRYTKEIVEGVYEIVPFTSGWRFSPAYNAPGQFLAVWSNMLDQFGQGCEGGKRMWRAVPQYCFDIIPTGKGTFYIRPFGCSILGVGAADSMIQIDAKFKDYEWTIGQSTNGYQFTSPAGCIKPKNVNINDNVWTLRDWVTYATSAGDNSTRYMQLYKLDSSAE